MIPIFPLVAGGVSLQLPIQRTWKPGQAVLTTPGGDLHLRTLPTGEHCEWRLKFTGLTAVEARTLQQFHRDMRGSYHSFRFCDPLKNLLAWSEDPTQSPWTRTSALSISLAAALTAGGRQAAQILNLSGDEGLLQQAVGSSPNFAYSMSVTAKSTSRSTLSLLIGDQRRSVELTELWGEYEFTAVPCGSVDQVIFAIAIPMGGSVDLSGVQADFGSCSAEYRRSSGTQGLMTKARFLDDLLVVSCAEYGNTTIETTVTARLGE